MTPFTNPPSHNACIAKLIEIQRRGSACISSKVADFALSSDYPDVGDFFRDLQAHGCVSGMIPDLIYYVDSHQFFDDHYAEIEELREEMSKMTGESLTIAGDLKNALAWFAFEETAMRLAQELGLNL